MKLKTKRGLYQFLMNLVASVFIGICAYGIIVNFVVPKKIPPILSISLGVLAIVCIVLIGIIGPKLDRIDVQLSEDPSSEIEEA